MNQKNGCPTYEARNCASGEPRMANAMVAGHAGKARFLVSLPCEGCQFRELLLPVGRILDAVVLVLT